MGLRLKLDDLLRTTLGSTNVYFQPPPSVSMKYPAIVYARDAASTEFADNRPFNSTQRYEVTLIDPDPDSPIISKLTSLPMCVFSRHFVADNLNHDVFTIYF